jgi:hypothetical protein
MDNTALIWKTRLDHTLATLQRARGKAVKSRITANFCCNASGTNKVPLWFIGNAAKTHYFAVNGVNIDGMDMVW